MNPNIIFSNLSKSEPAVHLACDDCVDFGPTVVGFCPTVVVVAAGTFGFIVVVSADDGSEVEVVSDDASEVEVVSDDASEVVVRVVFLEVDLIELEVVIVVGSSVVDVLLFCIPKQVSMCQRSISTLIGQLFLAQYNTASPKF